MNAEGTKTSAEMEAGAQLDALEAELARARRELDDAKAELTRAQRGREIDRLLIEAGAVDLDAGRVLAEAAIAGAPEADPAAAVAELRAKKPFIFRPRARVASATSAPEPKEDASHLTRLAEDARRTGDRVALLRYLRARRGI